MKRAISLLIVTIFFLQFTNQAKAASEPIAHFKFDDGSGTTPDDSSSNNITAAFTQTNPTWSTDVSSRITFTNPYSLDFTGNADGVTVTWPTSLNFSDTAPRSFSFWYKPTANGEGQYSRIISWSNDRLEIAGTSNTADNHKIAYFDGNWHDTDITLTLGTWYHVIFTYDGTTAKFYINNELQDEHSLAGRSLSGTLRIGNRVQQLDEGINGKIDDVRIYDYALNSTQIQNISNGSNNPDGDPSPTATARATTNTSYSSGSNTSCTAAIPHSQPNLFQISTSPTTATIYFSPVSPSTGYFVSYGQTKDADEYATSFKAKENSGVLSYKIQGLNASKKYYFKVRGMNDCVAGPWSNILSGSTIFFGYTPLPSPTPIKTGQSPKPSSKSIEKNLTSYDVTIRVTNGQKPVDGALVTLYSTPRQTTTDENGFARFDDVEKGEHEVVIEHDKFSKRQSIVIGGEDENITLDIKVEPIQNIKESPSFKTIIISTLLILTGLLFVLLLIKRSLRK